MLSGPDLGGGYLHQLSIDRDGEATTFTFHAQDGGSDAGGPPKGPLDVFGYVHPPSPCMFGGPRCWHRRFLLPPSEAPRVRAAYNRGRFVLEAMISQVYSTAPVPVEPGLAEVVQRLAPVLDSEGIEWYIGGSVAAWLEGARLEPHDLDLGTTRAGVDRIAALLSEYLIEPVGPTDWPGSGIVHAARAFVGTFRDGIRVEWSVPLEPREVRPFEEWSGRAGVARVEPGTFHGHHVRLTRPEYSLVRAAARGRTPVVAAIAESLQQHGVDRELLRALLDRTALPPSERERIVALLSA
ncbi:MAG TPA: hypothetical protein VEK13_07195 [Thermoplasmata archaeon]|nr:hypothetical protein [Thermoplasmata archaeon]